MKDLLYNIQLLILFIACFSHFPGNGIRHNGTHYRDVEEKSDQWFGASLFSSSNGIIVVSLVNPAIVDASRETDKLLFGAFTQLFFKQMASKSKQINEYPIEIVEFT